MNRSREMFPVDKEALLRRIRGEKVYVNPFRGEVSLLPSSASIGVPKTHWWSNDQNSPLFSADILKELIFDEIREMSIYFPDFNLFMDEDEDDVFWLGEIDGIGYIEILYPPTYPAQKFLVLALDLDESFNKEFNQFLWSLDYISPARALIVLMRFFLLKKVSGG